MNTKTKRLLPILSVCLAACLLLPNVFAAKKGRSFDNFENITTSLPSFSDVSENDWFYDEVNTIFKKGLMVGNSATTFNPTGKITLAETITIAARLHSIYHTGSENFKLESVWYQDYLNYARRSGILVPSTAYNDPVTRADFAQIIASSFPEDALTVINEIADKQIPDVTLQMDCGKAVYALYRAGILIGNDAKGTFAPDSNINRNEVAAIVTRLVVPEDRITLEQPEVDTPVNDPHPNPVPSTPEPPPSITEPTQPKEPEISAPTFVVESTKASAGQKRIAVTISAKNSPGITALALNVSYDSGITLAEIVYNDTIPGETMLPQTIKNPTKLLWINPFENVSGDFVLATLYFDVPSNTQPGFRPISITYNPDNVYNLSENNVHFDIVQGGIEITK